MLCYKGRSYCEDACLCAVSEAECGFKLTKDEGDRASALGLLISWSSFKDVCINFKAISCTQTK